MRSEFVRLHLFALVFIVLHAPEAPLVKGSWRRAPEGLPRCGGKGSPFRGAVSRRLTDRSSQICCNLSVSAFRRATSPGREALLLVHGFPYEGKLSAVRLADEVDNIASTKLPPPHPSRLRRATFPS